jgi:hypothetical protein
VMELLPYFRTHVVAEQDAAVVLGQRPKYDL